MNRYTTYEAIEQLKKHYVNKTKPPDHIRHKHVLIWLLSWSAAQKITDTIHTNDVPFSFHSVTHLLEIISAWKHVHVDRQKLLGTVVQYVHGGDKPLKEETWKFVLRVAEPLWVALIPPSSKWTLNENAPALICTTVSNMKLSCEAPDVRKTAMSMFYRAERRCTENTLPGAEASVIQKNRLPHIVAQNRKALLHADWDQMNMYQQELMILAQVHCVLFGNENFDFKHNVLAFEAELTIPMIHHTPYPIVAQTRNGYSLLWKGECSSTHSLQIVLNNWKMCILTHGLNPIDGRHNCVTL